MILITEIFSIIYIIFLIIGYKNKSFHKEMEEELVKERIILVVILFCCLCCLLMAYEGYMDQRFCYENCGHPYNIDNKKPLTVPIPNCVKECHTTSDSVGALSSCERYCGSGSIPAVVPLPKCKYDCHTTSTDVKALENCEENCGLSVIYNNEPRSKILKGVEEKNLPTVPLPECKKNCITKFNGKKFFNPYKYLFQDEKNDLYDIMPKCHQAGGRGGREGQCIAGYLLTLNGKKKEGLLLDFYEDIIDNNFNDLDILNRVINLPQLYKSLDDINQLSSVKNEFTINVIKSPSIKKAEIIIREQFDKLQIAKCLELDNIDDIDGTNCRYIHNIIPDIQKYGYKQHAVSDHINKIYKDTEKDEFDKLKEKCEDCLIINNKMDFDKNTDCMNVCTNDEEPFIYTPFEKSTYKNHYNTLKEKEALRLKCNNCTHETYYINFLESCESECITENKFLTNNDSFLKDIMENLKNKAIEFKKQKNVVDICDKCYKYNLLGMTKNQFNDELKCMDTCVTNIKTIDVGNIDLNRTNGFASYEYYELKNSIVRQNMLFNNTPSPTASVPASTIASVPVSIPASVPVSTPASVPASTIASVPASIIASVPVSTPASVLASTIASVPVSTSNTVNILNLDDLSTYTSNKCDMKNILLKEQCENHPSGYEGVIGIGKLNKWSTYNAPYGCVTNDSKFYWNETKSGINCGLNEYKCVCLKENRDILKRDNGNCSIDKTITKQYCEKLPGYRGIYGSLPGQGRWNKNTAAHGCVLTTESNVENVYWNENNSYNSQNNIITECSSTTQCVCHNNSLNITPTGI